jgi:hypothetical protein
MEADLGVMDDVGEGVGAAIPEPVGDGEGVVVEYLDDARVSPLGEISTLPLESDEATTTNRERAMKSRQCLSIVSKTLAVTHWGGAPRISRDWASVVMMSAKVIGMALILVGAGAMIRGWRGVGGGESEFCAWDALRGLPRGKAKRAC